MPSFSDVCNQFHVPVAPSGHRHVRRGWVGVDCPSCSPGWGKFRLGYELTTGRMSCWVCGLQQGPKAFEALFRVSEREARSLWASVSPDHRSAHLPIPVDTRRGKLVLPKGLGPLQPQHVSYLRRRGFDAEKIERLWGIKGIGLASRLAWRVWIPVHDQYGKVVSWLTRSISKDAELRYVTASPEEEEIDHKSLLYGSHLASHVAIISEGSIDAWAWGPGGVSTLGVNYSEAQMALMTQYPVRVVCFDDEPAAQRRADKLCNNLAAFPGQTESIQLESGKDAAEVLVNEPAELDEIRRNFGLV